MINEEKLNKIYIGLSQGKSLTTKELKSYGLDGNDISALIRKGIIKRVERGLYSFQAVNELYNYGKVILSKRDYENAKLCFQKCRELDSDYLATNFFLFFICIRNKEYSKAFEYFDTCFHSNNPYYESDNRFYLYLLSFITEIPEKYRSMVKEFSRESLNAPNDDPRYQDICLQNEIRNLAFEHHFNRAKEFCLLVPKNDRVKTSNLLTGILLTQVVEQLDKEISDLVVLVQEKQYDEIIEYLETIETQHKLITSEHLILSLAKDITEITKTGMIPEIKDSQNKFYSAILAKNYSLALSISKQYLTQKRNSPTTYAINTLLRDIVEIIDKQKSSQKKNPILEENKENKEEKPIISKKAESTSTFVEFADSLITQDLDSSLERLSKYLEKIDKKEFEFLIADLIKIGLLEKDSTYSKALTALSLLHMGIFQFELSTYVKLFYESIAKQEIEIAKVYLDILSKADRLDQNCIMIDDLTQILEIMTRRLNQNNDNLHEPLPSNNLEDKSSNDLKMPSTVKNEVRSLPKRITSFPKTEANLEKKPFHVTNKNPRKTETISIQKIDHSQNEWLKNRMPELEERGIILLNPMTEEEIQEVESKVNHVPNIDSFTIGKDKNKQVVLRLKTSSQPIDFSVVKEEGDLAYQEKEYTLCIEKYQQLLKTDMPNIYVYIRLGLSYMKNHQNDLAIDYLTVANELAKEQDLELDFSALIAKLKDNYLNEETKPRSRITLAHFEEQIDEKYGIENIEKMLTSKMNIHQISKQLGFSEEEKTLVELILAKKYYTRGQTTLGNQYLKLAERGKNKPEFLKDQVEEVSTNKKYYKYRNLVLVPSTKGNN